MTDRVILAVKYTPAAASSQVRKAVGGFLRYVQHRDLHPTQPDAGRKPEVAGLLKYVAYRDRASMRAELFGPKGTLGSESRKAFASFVAHSLEQSAPQSFRGRDGKLHDRRRAVYRFVISPEHASGIDLRRLTSAAVGRLENDSGLQGLRWIAAIHRNTAHHHVHLVVAGMHQDSPGVYRRVDITRQRLAAMKEALGLEIERQRAQRTPVPVVHRSAVETPPAPTAAVDEPAARRLVMRPTARPIRWHREATHHGSLIALRAVARRYERRMQRELEDSYRHAQWDYAA